MNTYSTHAAICAKFYDLTLDAQKVSEFVLRNSGCKAGDSGLFVGGMFEVARGILERGTHLTVVDYTDEMVRVGSSKLPGTVVQKADLRALPFVEQFDVVFVVGRVFTHMITDRDLAEALRGCRRSLRQGGRLFFDNYEDTKIQRTTYFNGTVECRSGATSIKRVSSTTKISDSPYVVQWDAEYVGNFEGKNFSFSDSIEHRAFSRAEIASVLSKHAFNVVSQGDNFDDTSFFTAAVAV